MSISHRQLHIETSKVLLDTAILLARPNLVRWQDARVVGAALQSWAALVTADPPPPKTMKQIRANALRDLRRLSKLSWIAPPDRRILGLAIKSGLRESQDV